MASNEGSTPHHTIPEEVEWLSQVSEPGQLFLSKANGGLDLPELTTVYKKLHTAKAASYMCFRDTMVRSLATQEMLRESGLKRLAFRPFQEVVDVMKQDLGTTKKKSPP